MTLLQTYVQLRAGTVQPWSVLPACLPIYMLAVHVCLPACLPACLSVCLSVCLVQRSKSQGKSYDTCFAN